MKDLESVARLNDRALIASLKEAARQERRLLAEVLTCLIEFDKRRLYASEGFPSLFEYCTRELGYPEEAAYKRIRAARAAAKFPVILRMLRADRLKLTAVVILHPYLSRENHRELLERARGMSTRELGFLAASFSPKPDLTDHLRRLPSLQPGVAQPAASPPAGAASLPAPTQHNQTPTPAEVADSPAISLRPKIQPLSEDRVRIAFTAGREMLLMIDRAKELLRHRHPGGNLEAIFVDALQALLQRVDPLRRLKAKRARKARSCSDPRRVPQAVRDAVWLRDGGQCTFIGPGGLRCCARGALEFDHAKPFALGGRSDDPDNIRLMCRAHNALEARRVFGNAAVEAALAKRKSR